MQEELDLGPVFIDEVPHGSKRKATSPLIMSREPEVMSTDDNLELITVEVVAGDEGKVRIKVRFHCILFSHGNKTFKKQQNSFELC